MAMVAARMLFSPSGRVEGQLASLWRKHAEGKFVIVLQMRTGIGSDFTVFSQQEFDSGLTDFFRAANAIEEAHVARDTPVLWWLITDRRAIRDMAHEKMQQVADDEAGARQREGGRSLFWYQGDALHMDKVVDAAEVERTFVEWFAVSRAQALVLTLESSFALSSWMMSYRARPRPLHAVVTPRRAREGGLELCRDVLQPYQCGPADVCLADDRGERCLKSRFPVSCHPCAIFRGGVWAQHVGVEGVGRWQHASLGRRGLVAWCLPGMAKLFVTRAGGSSCVLGGCQATSWQEPTARQ